MEAIVLCITRSPAMTPRAFTMFSVTKMLAVTPAVRATDQARAVAAVLATSSCRATHRTALLLATWGARGKIRLCAVLSHAVFTSTSPSPPANFLSRTQFIKIVGTKALKAQIMP